jgi:hypothetical protein
MAPFSILTLHKNTPLDTHLEEEASNCKKRVGDVSNELCPSEVGKASAIIYLRDKVKDCTILGVHSRECTKRNVYSLHLSIKEGNLFVTLRSPKSPPLALGIVRKKALNE